MSPPPAARGRASSNEPITIFFLLDNLVTNNLPIHLGCWPTCKDIAGPMYNNGSHVQTSEQ